MALIRIEPTQNGINPVTDGRFVLSSSASCCPGWAGCPTLGVLRPFGFAPLLLPARCRYSLAIEALGVAIRAG